LAPFRRVQAFDLWRRLFVSIFLNAVMESRVNSGIWVVVLFAAVLAVRMGGASDLHQNEDQTRSLSFTADVVLNRNWVLPRDTTGEPARKPPLINWVGALLPALGVWSEWALKFPSILGGALAVGSCLGAARRLACTDPSLASDADWFAAASAALYLACPETVKHIYFFRPDMLNTAWLTGAWFFSLGMFGADAARSRRNALGYWLCVGLAALTKGTTALIALIYLPFAARALGGSWRALGRTGWGWGLPLASALFGLWAIPLLIQHGEFVKQVLIREETVSRVGAESFWFWKALATSWKIPYWFCERFLPWSVFAVAALLLIKPAGWLRSGLAPAALWVLATLVFFVPVEHRGGSYFMPAHPAAAVLAAWCLSRGCVRLRLAYRRTFGLAAVVALALVFHKGFLGDDARRGAGDAIKSFAREAQAQVGTQAVVFVHVRLNPVIMLMGRHQAGEAPEEARAAYPWAVYAVAEEDLSAFENERAPVLVSRRLERDIDHGRGQYLCLVRRDTEQRR
jgi:4-amino-4-deoxy-L-arabinose transferase-like glycosyltransferase